MFVEHRPKWRSIVTVIVLSAIVAAALLLLLTGEKFEAIIPLFSKFTAISLVAGMMFFAITEKAWRWKWVRNWCRWITATPDLNGRWVGNYVSSFDKQSRPTALEVTQSLLTLQCVDFGRDTIGHSYVARLLSDIDDHDFVLVYFFHSKRDHMTSIPGDEHEGMMWLRYIEGHPNRLEGWYVNDRDPPRRGDIKLQWESNTRLRKLCSETSVAS